MGSKLKIDAATKINYEIIKPTIKQLMAKVNLSFDLTIQRQFVWDRDRQSMLIYSILSGYPIPLAFARWDRAEDIYHMMDGKQRLTTITTFVLDGEVVKDANGKALVERDKDNKPVMGADNKPLLQRHVGWALQNIPPITFVGEDGETFEDDLNGLTFDKLPDYAKDIILAREIPITRITGMEDDEQDEFFRLVNNGVPLTKFEISRSMAGGVVMSFINKVAAQPFFANTIGVSVNDKHFTREEIVAQIVRLVYHMGNEGTPDLSGNSIQSFLATLNEQGGVGEDQKTLIEQVTEYLGDAIPDRMAKLKKVHVPMVFMTAIKALQDGVPAAKFGGWVQDFFGNRYAGAFTYQKVSTSGSAKPENVAIRLREMFKDFDAHIAKAPEYKTPTKGRKPKESGDSNPVIQGESQTQNENQNELVGAGANA